LVFHRLIQRDSGTGILRYGLSMDYMREAHQLDHISEASCSFRNICLDGKITKLLSCHRLNSDNDIVFLSFFASDSSKKIV